MGKLDAFDTIGLTLAARDDEIFGRTTLQKLIYFETVKIPEIHLSEPYIAYFYGPFNKDIARSLEQMVVFDILQEQRKRGFHSSYLYKVTEKGTPIIDKVLKKFERTFIKIEDLVNTCNEFCALNPNPLSFAAKIHYIFQSQKKKALSLEDLIKLERKFGWNISRDDIREGTELLEQLNLVKINR